MHILRLATGNVGSWSDDTLTAFLQLGATLYLNANFAYLTYKAQRMVCPLGHQVSRFHANEQLLKFWLVNLVMQFKRTVIPRQYESPS